MRLLLDTHVALWSILDPDKLAESAKRWIVDPSNVVAVSVVTLWEIAIKRSVSRQFDLAMSLTPSEAQLAFEDADLEIMGVAARHFDRLETLPFHHRDPFDRLLVATAQVEGFTVLTVDTTLKAYGDCVTVV